jgi:hydroxypyruvate reductase
MLAKPAPVPGTGDKFGHPSLGQVFLSAVQAVGGRALGRAGAGGIAAERVLLCGAGKASAALAAGVEDALGDRVIGGLVVVKAGNRGDVPRGVRSIEAAHPVPDATSAAAAAELVEVLRSCPAGAEIVFVLSGGASALLAAPVAGLPSDALAAAGRALVHGGAPIGEINLVRRRLHRAAGGRLALECAAPVHVLVMSDVLGNHLPSIGSGPFHGEPARREEALAIARATPGFPALAIECLERGADPPRPDDPRLAHVRHQILADHEALADAAEEAARRHGLFTVRLPPASDDVEAVAARYAALPTRAGGVLYIGGGEPTVRVPAGAGRGGRAQHLALAMALHLEGRNAAFLAGGSDGSDGDTPATGALVDGNTLEQARTRGLDLQAAHTHFNSHPALAALDALLVTGPTGTNLLDLHLLQL